MAQPKCGSCGNPVEHLEVRTGVRLNETTEISGHYACVVKALGPERTLKAIRAGLLPAYSDEDFEGHRLKKHVAFFAGQRRARFLDEIEG